MKTDISHLPDDKRDELRRTTEIIREAVEPEMVILFGSHARGDWVEDEETGYISDYDILVIVRPRHVEGGSNRLHERVERQVADTLRHSRVNAIAHRIDFVNSKLGEGQYFFTDIVNEGVMLYDSGRYTLAKAKELDDAERKRIAEQDLEQWFESASNFYVLFEAAFEKSMYKEAAFQLHQASERFYAAILLVHAGHKPRTHDIERLGKLSSPHVPGLARVFQRSTPEEEKRFDLLKRAYVDARYDPEYTVTCEDLEYLGGRVRELKASTEEACRKRIEGLGGPGSV